MEIKIKVVALNTLTPYEKNARKHSDSQINQIMASMQEFGFTVPLLESGGIIVAGHGRYEAAKRLYAAGETIKLTDGQKLPSGAVPVIDCSNWTDKQRRAYTLADNRLSEIAEWDNELLYEELSFLEEESFNPSEIGFSLTDLDSILGAPKEVDEPETEWQGMPEFVQNDEMPKRTLKVHFDHEKDVQTFAKCVGQKITDKTKFIWFPFKEKSVLKSRRYISDES